MEWVSNHEQLLLGVIMACASLTLLWCGIKDGVGVVVIGILAMLSAVWFGMLVDICPYGCQ